MMASTSQRSRCQRLIDVRTIETDREQQPKGLFKESTEGGVIVVMLLSTLDSLTKLCSLTMHVHSRVRTESHGSVVPRFNQELVLSLAGCEHCILLDQRA
jgi:tRNA(Met) C34 N-acetyltransferase TmcA